MKNHQLPIYLNNSKFITHEDIHSHDTRNKTQMSLPIIKLDYLRRKINYRVGEVINSLSIPTILKMTTHSLSSILKNYKNNLIINEYNKISSGCYMCEK